MNLIRPKELVARPPRDDNDDWEYLDKHLADVARAASEFAEAFGFGALGFVVGLWHDLGKANPEWQDKLWDDFVLQRTLGRNRRTKKPHHAIWGAAYAYEFLRAKQNELWHEISLPIKAHHSRLSDGGVAATDLVDFVARTPDAVETMRGCLRQVLAMPGVQPLPLNLSRQPALERELRTRMLLSALVDADRLTAEIHGGDDAVNQRRAWPDLEQMWSALEAHQNTTRDESTLINRIRWEVYQACCDAAIEAPGLFRLTVPTGGGKTRSALAFALRHAIEHGLRRIVVALPYTSIIDQTVQVYRDILGDEAVLEHHSAIEPAGIDHEDGDFEHIRLASENWDATLIVTTTVQLFESLFASSASRARKIHQLAKSVIILDEVQALPPELLIPTIDVIGQLAKPVADGGYGATVVFSTATQPAFETDALRPLLAGARVHEIVTKAPDHFKSLERVCYDWRREPITWDELASEVRPLRQVMVVLNTRKDALTVLNRLEGEKNVLHLSALLCGAHRRAVLQRVRELIAANRPVRLICTQVVECGVDLDFPVVYRALGPLDRVVQAAGRCNRNFKQDKGQVIVFQPSEGSAPRGPYMKGIEKARLLMKDRDPKELHDPSLYRTYFDQLFHDIEVESDNLGRKVQEKREVLNFPETASLYRLIRDDTVPVVVPYGLESAWRLEDLMEKPSRRTWQRIQPYVINLYQHEVKKHEFWLKDVMPGLFLWTGAYDSERHRGIVEPLSDPSDLIV